MQVTINSLDLGYTIDTYGMFNGDSVDEGEQEYYQDEYKLTDAEAQQIDFDYDHKGIVESLAKSSIQLLHENLVQHGDGVVTEIEYISNTSPQFYNYTTDSYKADWTIDEYKLEAYAVEHLKEFEAFVSENWDYEWQKAVESVDSDTLAVIKLDYYTRNTYDIEDYEMSMFEHESEAYTENMKVTEEFQKILDSKEKTNV